jgi:hypothetical protein
VWIPRIIGGAEYLEDAGDHATLAATQADLRHLKCLLTPMASALDPDGWAHPNGSSAASNPLCCLVSETLPIRPPNVAGKPSGSSLAIPKVDVPAIDRIGWAQSFAYRMTVKDNRHERPVNRAGCHVNKAT